MRIRIQALKSLESLLALVGLVLLAIATVLYVSGRVYSRLAVARFNSEVHAQNTSGPPPVPGAKPVDYSLWSEKRIHQYEASLAEHFDEPLALLHIDKIHLEVPVFNGTDEPILNRGVGRIIGTAKVGESGNLGIAGHRDGFFRGLKDVTTGDTVELETADGTQTYVIDSIKIVEPNDVSVLQKGPSDSLTLVTCFPFYFIGSAPQRYIVHASLTGASETPNAFVKASLKSHSLKPEGENK
jgi:sortase A